MKIVRFLFIFTSFFIIPQSIYAASLPPVKSKHAMVVSAQHYATQVGVNILKKGGNAIDAAVAIGYALAVVHPCCGNIGGGGFMLIRQADGKRTFLNFREKAPLALKSDLFLDKEGRQIKDTLSTEHIGGALHLPYLAVGVPGTVLGLNTALQKYGTLSLKEVIQPAIKLAKDGFTLQQGDVDILQLGVEGFKTESNIANIFLKNGENFKTGDRLIQKELADTLTAIAQQGSDAFYRGKIAETIVEASNKHNGVLTKKDFETYTVQELKPINCQYRGYTIITAPPPSAGGMIICETLNIVEGYPLNQLGFHAAQSTHYTLDAIKSAFADRRFIGDPDFIKNPIDIFISKNYARQIRHFIKPDQMINTNSIQFLQSPSDHHHTTGYVVVDQKGNAVAVTYTINDYFGAKIIAGNTGFFLNNEMADFTLTKGEANAMASAKRPVSSMAPTIITKNNQLTMLLSTPGGSTIPTQLVNVIQNVFDFGMNIQEAVDAPRFHTQLSPSVVFIEPYTFSNDTLAILKKMKYQFYLGSPYRLKYWGAVAAIMIDPTTRALLGAMDSRKPAGLALGF